MNKVTESAVSGQDQFIDGAQCLRDNLLASVREVLRCVQQPKGRLPKGTNF